MNIVVYTIANWDTIGGGRRVSLELVKNFNRLGHDAAAWSLYPYEPEKYYNGQYSFETESYLSRGEKIEYSTLKNREAPRIAETFVQYIRERKIDFILIDNEFSLREFCSVILKHLKFDERPMIAAMVHDQLWINNPEAMTIGSDTQRARAAKEELFVHQIKASQEKLRRELMEKIYGPAIDRTGRIRRVLRRLGGWKVLKDMRRNNRETSNILEFKSYVRQMDFTVHQTPRSAYESAAAFNFEPERALCALGVYSDDDTIIPSNRDFRAESASQGQSVILAFSRMAPEKGIDVVLSAFAKALSENPNMCLWVAGQIVEGNMEHYQYVKDVASQYGLDGKVYFWGELSEEDMAAIYQQTDSFICLQPNDTTISVYSALRNDKPVVVSGAYSFPDFLEESGMIVYQGDTLADYAQSILESVSSGRTLDSKSRSYVKGLSYRNYAQTILGKAESVMDLKR